MTKDDGRRKMGVGLQDDSACTKCTMPGSQTKEQILVVVVWLKLNRKYFNKGMAKEACDRFEVRAKQLSRVLTGSKYLGGTQAKKCKATETATTTQEPPV